MTSVVSGRWLPLPFPECVSCDRSWGQCVHADCRGEIEVEPLSGHVKCLRCSESWLVWQSDFLCPCGARFQASKIKDGLAEMLDYCRQLVYEMSLNHQARKERREMGEESMRSFLMGVMEGLGKLIGVAVEATLRFFFPR